MPISRLAYRVRQFWSVLAGPRTRVETESLQPHLSPPLIVLFFRMQASEQAHAYRVFEHLKASGQTDPDLLAAALLHDVGKIQSPLGLLDRVLVVLGHHFFRRAARRWSQGAPSGLHRPFVVAASHAAWGADLAGQAGASSRTMEWIRRHHDPPSGDDPLLDALQAADQSL